MYGAFFLADEIVKSTFDMVVGDNYQCIDPTISPKPVFPTNVSYNATCASVGLAPEGEIGTDTFGSLFADEYAIDD